MINAIDGARGIFEADQVLAAIRPPMRHAPKATLVAVEQTANMGGGSVWPLTRLAEVAEAGRGVVVLIREPRPTSLLDRMKARHVDSGGDSEKDTEKDTRAGSGVHPVELRDYGVGAQILLDLGLKEMILLSNTQHTVVGLDGYGLSIVEQRPLSRSSATDIRETG